MKLCHITTLSSMSYCTIVDHSAIGCCHCKYHIQHKQIGLLTLNCVSYMMTFLCINTLNNHMETSIKIKIPCSDVCQDLRPVEQPLKCVCHPCITGVLQLRAKCDGFPHLCLIVNHVINENIKKCQPWCKLFSFSVNLPRKNFENQWWHLTELLVY